MTRSGAVYLWIFILVFASGLAGCSSGNSAEAIANRLAEAFDFDNPTELVQGTPPQATTTGNAPVVTNVSAPSKLAIGQPFVLSVSYQSSNPQDVRWAIVHVKDSAIYLKVAVSAMGGMIDLAGRLSDALFIQGRQFAIEVGLQTGDGVVGEYGIWDLKVSQEKLPSTMGPEQFVTADGGTFFSSGRPKGSAESDAPQIEYAYISEPQTKGSQTDLEAWISTFFAGDISAVYMSSPGSDAYIRITNLYFSNSEPNSEEHYFAIRFRLDESQLKISEETPVIFSFAIESSTGKVGLWTPASYYGSSPSSP